MRSRLAPPVVGSGRSLFTALFIVGILSHLVCVSPRINAQHKPSGALPRPRRLDDGITWKRDPATGELTVVLSGAGHEANVPEYAGNAHSISVVTQIVPVACSVVGADGVAIQNLQQKDFRVFDDGADQPVVYFDASSQPASVAIMLDASPSEHTIAVRVQDDAVNQATEKTVVK